jgi:predicted RNA-binding protein with PIN domain
MSLHFIIDGYNIIHHHLFNQQNNIKIKEPKQMLSEFIRINRLCGSPKNKVTVVFDGYPDTLSQGDDINEFNIIFSRKNSADARIKQMLENSGNPKNIIVVSDDKEIKLFTKSFGARAMGVEEFIGIREGKKARSKETAFKPELSYTQMFEINEELKKIWLKKL